MADEQEPAVSPELDNPAIEPDAEIDPQEPPEVPQDVGTEGDQEGGDDPDGGEGDPPEIEYVTLDVDGKQYQVPKELEGMFLKNKDYTQKTQATAAKAKELDERETQLKQQAEVSEAELDARAELSTVTKQLAEFAKLTQADWDAHHNNDPMGTDKAWRHFHFLKDQKAELEGKISTAQTERTEKAQQELAKRVQDTVAFAKESIPGWKPELTDTLVKFAVEDMQVPEALLKDNWSPTLYKLLHRAHLGEQSLKKQAAAIKPAPKQPIAPLSTVTPKGAPVQRRSLSELAKGDDMEAYAAARAAKRG